MQPSEGDMIVPKKLDSDTSFIYLIVPKKLDSDTGLIYLDGKWQWVVDGEFWDEANQVMTLDPCSQCIEHEIVEHCTVIQAPPSPVVVSKKLGFEAFTISVLAILFFTGVYVVKWINRI